MTRVLVLILILLMAAMAAPAQKQAAYEPTWESLKQYKAPAWYEDAKFGIFIHWGVYAVPAYGNEWYPRRMYQKFRTDSKGNVAKTEDPVWGFHAARFGPRSKFGYKDFVPMFKAEKFNAAEWAELFRKSGARYVVPVAEHHDGFAMYASSQTKWNSAQMGPRSDVLGEIAAAVRKRGMVLGASTHYAFNWRYYTFGQDFDTNDPANSGLYGKPHPPDAPASPEFLEHWYARTKEIVDKYQPQVLWFDFCIRYPEFEPYRKKIAAYYYNQGRAWKRGVALNYKGTDFPEGTAVLDIERGKLDKTRDMVWQTDTSISLKSWGYIEDDEFRNADSLVDDLVDIVSKNGVLLLNVGPKADGTIPDQEQKVLLEIGKWLGVNGEAIYGTRPWKVFGEGPTEVLSGGFTDRKSKPFTAQDIRITRKGDVLYAIVLDWPGSQLVVKSLAASNLGPRKIAFVRLLGSKQNLKFKQEAGGLTVEMPSEKPCDYAYALKIALK